MNIRSLSCHFDELHSLFVNLNVKFDVVGVSETWDSIKNPLSTNVNISGYSFFSTKSKSQNGGVGLYARTGLGPVPKPDLNATYLTMIHIFLLITLLVFFSLRAFFLILFIQQGSLMNLQLSLIISFQMLAILTP